MATNNYTLALTASLQKTASKKQINADIKQLEKALSLLRVTGTFTKGETKRELNDCLHTLQSQLDHIKLSAKLDSQRVQREINDSLSKITFRDIDPSAVCTLLQKKHSQQAPNGRKRMLNFLSAVCTLLQKNGSRCSLL